MRASRRRPTKITKGRHISLATQRRSGLSTPERLSAHVDSQVKHAARYVCPYLRAARDSGRAQELEGREESTVVGYDARQKNMAHSHRTKQRQKIDTPPGQPVRKGRRALGNETFDETGRE